MNDAMHKKTGISQSSAFFLTASLLLVGCIAPGDGSGTPEAPQCSTSFTHVIEPSEIKKHRLYFNTSDFEFLLNPENHIEDISLHLTLKGKQKGHDCDDKSHGHHKDENQESAVTLDLNGLQANSSSGASFYNYLGYLTGSDSSQHSFKLHRMRLNGAESIEAAIFRIKRHKGQILIGLHGKDIKVLSARIEIKGYNLESCSLNPDPTPTFTPVAPDTFINSVSPAGSPVSSSTMAFLIGSDQAAVNFLCSLDGIAATCGSDPTYSTLANGPHSFTVAATNSAGLTDATPATYSWIADTAPPSVTITNRSSLATLTRNTDITFQFIATDLSPSTFTCSLDGALASACASPITYTGLAEGGHYIAISAVDAAGNLSTSPAIFQWMVDVTAPTTLITQVTPASSITNLADASIAFGASESATFECAIDGASYAACTSPVALSALTEGLHSIQVRATDVAGNTGSEASHLWTVDVTAPVVSLGQVLPPPGLTRAQTVSVEFAANEQSTYQCSFDGILQGACTSPFSVAISAEGNHEFRVIATDSAGNPSAPVLAAWIMDFTLPQIAWGAILPSAASYISSADLSAEITSSEALSLSCTLNAADLGISGSPIVLTGLSEGAYLLAATGTDAAGNIGTPITHAFNVDRTAPIVTMTATYSRQLTAQTVNSFTFSANEAASFECNLVDAGFIPCVSPVQVSGLAEDTHAFEVRATDLAGNVGYSELIQWTVDFTAPVTTIAVTQLSNNDFTFALTANESVQAFDCALDGSSLTSCGATLSYTGLAVGTHTFTARATDLTGNVDQVGTSVNVLVLPPIATILGAVNPATTLSNSTDFSAAFTSNQAGATFLCSMDGVAATDCTSPANYSGLGEGTHRFKVNALDRFGTPDMTGATYLWNVDLTAPITLLAPSRNTNADILFSFTANEATSGFACSLDGGAYSTCLSAVTYNGLAMGNHVFMVKATDLAGNMETSAVTYNWAVDPAIQTFITSTAPSASLTNSSMMAVSFNANLAGATFVCSLDGQPDAACSSPNTASDLTPGLHRFVVHAIDRWGTMDLTGATHTWQIDQSAPLVLSFSLGQGGGFIMVNWTTSEPATSMVNWGAGSLTNRVVAEDSNYVTSHSVKVSGLTAGSTYSFIVSGRDRAGNRYTSSRKTQQPF